MAVIGLDVGTSGVKSTLFADDAKIIGHAYREYNLIGGEGEYELDPRELWDKTRQVLAESVRDYAGTVDAISVTSFGESFVCLDEDDQVLCNTMIYMDPRGQKECDEFRQDHDPVAVLGKIDARKVRSCMTLFALADEGEPVFRDVLRKYYGGIPDERTLELLGVAWPW